ncbi:hypothetical protein DMENIID0001_113310 [Sergentomyia squamirostris]
MGKFNEEQLKTVLEFMTKYPVMLQKRTRDNNKSRMSLWKELTEKLNKQGPPFKSDIDWRRSWAKKKFEMGKVKKRRVSVYADLDNLLARASELNESEDEYEVASNDPLDVKRENSSKSRLETRNVVPPPMKVEMEEEEIVEYITNPNEYEPIDQSVTGETSSPPPQVQTPIKKRIRKRSVREGSQSETSAEETTTPESSSRRKRSRRESRKSENSVELFFRSLAMEVNKANLSSENLFKLEWSVLKVVSEKIKEFTAESSSVIV